MNLEPKLMVASYDCHILIRIKQVTDMPTERLLIETFNGVIHVSFLLSRKELLIVFKLQCLLLFHARSREHHLF